MDRYKPDVASTALWHGVTQLNSKYTFETFVIGSSNRFAHAAAVAVAEAPAKAYNPLFIYGDSGLGKTHLLHAIGHYAQTFCSGPKVRYVSSEEFTNDFINLAMHTVCGQHCDDVTSGYQGQPAASWLAPPRPHSAN